MPYFAIHCIDKPDAGALRSATRPAHLAYLDGQNERGRIYTCGPLLSESGEPIGSLLIVEVPDRRAAYDFAAHDPYAEAGLFASVAVTSWRRIYPE